ncbi:hypothetical protein JW921_00035, partial [Candidatus Fermentibacterales bacterium]|nr:hypothetical protein [Candidatus Fermentibacterales bacterium]
MTTAEPSSTTARSPSPGRRGDRELLLVVLFSVLALSVLHPYPYDNVQTRWALTRRLVEHGSIDITPWSHLTCDVAFYEGRYYCDKAVMTSLLAALPHAPLYWISRAAGWDGAGGFQAFARFLSERVVCTGSLVLLLLLLARLARSRGEPALIPLLAVGLGSVLLPYSTLLYGHVPAAAAIFASFFFQSRGRYGLADLFGALASAIEFPVLLPFAVLLLYRPRSSWGLRPLARLAGITLACFLPQILHNWIAFGSPFRMGYSLEASEAFGRIHEGLFGFTLPKLSTAYTQLLSAERGLLFYMPWALPGFLGFFAGRGFRRVLRTDPRPLLVVLFLLLFSSTFARTGGWAYGPRYLIPVVPFLASGLGRFGELSPVRRGLVMWLLLPAVLLTLL